MQGGIHQRGKGAAFHGKRSVGSSPYTKRHWHCYIRQKSTGSSPFTRPVPDRCHGRQCRETAQRLGYYLTFCTQNRNVFYEHIDVYVFFLIII